MSDAAVRDNVERQRYELVVEGATAIAAYSRSGDTIVFTHTEVPEALQGRGMASRLIAGALADVRAHGRTIVPACAFVAAYLRSHPEEQDLLARRPGA